MGDINQWQFPKNVAGMVVGWADDGQRLINRNSGDGAFTQSVTGAVARTISGKLGETKSVKDFGAVGDGVTNDLTAFQTALDNHSHIVVPPGNYILNGTLEINDFNVLVGIGPHTAGDTTTAATSTARLIFTNTTVPCIKAADESTALLHAGFMNLTLRATTTATWFWDFKTVVGLKMAFIRANAINAATGGFRSVKINHSDSSWAANWTDVEIRIDDASAQHTIDTDMSDSAILGGSYTGGIGAILRGTGGMRLIGGRYDRSSGYGITISNETESKSQHTVLGCQIEENATGGVLIDGDADDTLTETWVTPIVVGNHFRNPAASYDIVLKNTSGPALMGGLIGPNSHNLSAVNPININGNWTRVTINPSAHASTSRAQPRSYLGAEFRQSSLVLSRGTGNFSHTGDTSETTLLTISVPANALGTTGQLRITTLWEYTNSANNKSLRVKFGGTTFTGVTTTTQAASQFITEIANISASTQIGAPANFTGIGSSTAAVVTAAVDTTTAQNITITAQLANAGESIALRRYLVEIFPSSS